MKKRIFFLLFLSMNSLFLYDVSARNVSLEMHPDYIYFKNQVTLLKNRSLKYVIEEVYTGAKKGFILYSYLNIPLILLENLAQELKNSQQPENNEQSDKTVTSLQPENRDGKYVPATITSIMSGYGPSILLGAIGGGICAQWRQFCVVGTINRVLTKYHTGYQFATLSMDAAIMVLAAYDRNLLMVEKMSEYLPDFLKQSGTIEALTELYYGKTKIVEIVREAYYKKAPIRETLAELYYRKVSIDNMKNFSRFLKIEA